METQRKSKGIYWLLFVISCIGFVLLLMFKGQLVTLSLPFICTFFAKALDIM